MTAPALPDQAYAAAIGALPDMTPVRLRRLLRDCPAALVYEELVTGGSSLARRLVESDAPRTGRGHPEQLTAARELLRWWSSELAAAPPAAVWARLRAEKVTPVRDGDPGYPLRLARLALRPEVLYVKGDLSVAEGPSVAIVGTRRATYYGLGVAEEFGAELAARGVAIISGLALGIDAAAHGGALARVRSGSGPVAVLGGGVDVVYPPRNRALYARVLEHGAVVSEAPLGARPLSWRFPLRNRLIAGLCDVLVVVESSRQGGSMHTVEAADQIGVPILAVPGSVRSSQSEGTNLLISQGGAHPALDVGDIVAALSRTPGGAPARLSETPSATGGRSSGSGRLRPRGDTSVDNLLLGCSEAERALYRLLGDDPTHVDSLCDDSGLALRAVVLALDRLCELRLVEPRDSGWVRT